MQQEIKLSVREATTDSLAPFGRVITHRDREPTFDSPEFAFFADLAIAGFGPETAFGMVVARPGPLTATTFERHHLTPELVAPLDGEVVVILGAKSDQGPPPVTDYTAFRVRPGTVLLLDPGVWHFAPLAIDSIVSILIGFRRGTPSDDVEIVNLEEQNETRFLVESV